MANDEAALIQRAKDGDPAAFAEIYDRHQPAIYRYVFYRVEDAPTAEDITSEVFIRLVEKIDHFTYRGKPILSWLYTIARHLITDHYRRDEPLELKEELASSKELSERPDIGKRIDRKMAYQEMQAAISELTEDQRQVILLKFMEGFDNKSTARLLGKSVGAVKSLQHRGLASLKRILSREEP